MGVIHEPNMRSILVGKALPNLKLPTLEHPNDVVNVSSLLHGKVTVITIWASWCADCRQRIHDLALLKKKYKSDINLIGVAYRDKREDAARWILSAENPFAVNLYDSEGSVAIEYILFGMPDSVIIDERGNVIGWSFDVAHDVDQYMRVRKVP